MRIDQTNPLVPTTSKSTPEQIRKVAKEFESIFTSMMLRAMRKTVGENPLVPESMGEEIYTGMLDDEYSKTMSEHASLGLSDMIVKEIERQLGTANSSLKQLHDLKNDPWSTDSRFLGNPITGMGNVNQQKPLDATAVAARISKWDDLITRASELHGVDKTLVAAVVAQESGGNQYAVSPKGAKGLMQLMDTTASDLGVTAPFSPWANISGGTKYLRQLLDRFGGDEKRALASYNAGPAAVEKYHGIPPYRETENYVSSVIALKNHFNTTVSKGKE